MTVCIAAMCDKGTKVVVASDTTVTNMLIPIEFEHLQGKISRLSPTCVAMTAGDALAYTELFSMVTTNLSALREPSIFDIVDNIKSCYKDVRHQEIRERILGPRGLEDLEHFYKLQTHLEREVVYKIQNQIDTYDYGLEILVAGMSGARSHIYGVIDPGTSLCFDAINFHAIGSGMILALNSLISNSCDLNKSYQETIIAVFQAKRLAEKAPGVGTETDMAIVMDKGALWISREEIQNLIPIHEKWQRKDDTWEEDLNNLITRITQTKTTE